MQSRKSSKTQRRLPPWVTGWERRCGSVADSCALALYRGLGTGLGAVAEGLLMKQEYRALIDLEVNPLDYDDAWNFRDDYLVSSLMSKYPVWDIGVDREAVAFEKFESAESACGETNLRLMWSVKDVTVGDSSTEAILYRARGKIRSLLRSFSWDLCSQHFGFGPGGTFATPKRRGDSYYKFGDNKPTTTRGNLALAYAAIAVQPTWFRHVTGFSGKVTPEVIRELAWYADEFFTIVDGNKVSTVPKNAKTDRTIAKEPLMNAYVQRGIGMVIGKKLRRVGINLKDQTKNQRLALLGSVDGSLATMDLKAASDSVSLELCKLLLPSDWFTAIELCRSPCGILPDGRQITYQKVSSMGNGFTFELESLIFWALCSACLDVYGGSDRRLSVYGDDLIFPVGAYDLIEKTLLVCGFTANSEKSFRSGQFRESCGKHYFNGIDVTPVFIRKDICTIEARVLYSNELRCWSVRPTYGLDKRLFDAWSSLTAQLPTWVSKLRMPYQYTFYKDGIKTDSWNTSGALIGDFDEVRPPRAIDCLEGWTHRLISKTTESRVHNDAPFFLKCLSTAGREGGEATAVNLAVVKIQQVNVLYSQWPSYGPWL